MGVIRMMGHVILAVNLLMPGGEEECALLSLVRIISLFLPLIPDVLPEYERMCKVAISALRKLNYDCAEGEITICLENRCQAS